VDSITKLGPEYRGKVLVAGSHGGRYCGYLAALAGLRGVILNDAGVGKDSAGIGALAYLEPLGLPAATVAHTSARIGDGADLLARGRVSFCNEPARRLGCEVGQACRDATARLSEAPAYEGEAPAYAEARTALPDAPFPLRIILCDSASLVVPADEGALVITGSHGGMLAGRPGYGIAAAAAGAVFNDAGVGVEEAGIRRLPVLEASGIPAVTVSAESARIGDARSAWETGRISHMNPRASALGLAAGDSVEELARRLAGTPARYR